MHKSGQLTSMYSNININKLNERNELSSVENETYLRKLVHITGINILIKHR